MESHERIGKRLGLAVLGFAELDARRQAVMASLAELSAKRRALQERERVARAGLAELRQREAQILLRCADADASP